VKEAPEKGKFTPVMEITSRDNPLIRRIKQMQAKRKYRRKENAFFVEGIPFVEMSIDCGARVTAVVFCEALLTDKTAQAIVTGQRGNGVRCVALSRQVYEHVSQRNNPDGLGAVLETQWEDLDSLGAGKDDVFLALVDVADPGNLGTILRTLESVGGAGCILIGKSTDPFHPRAVRASKGAVFKVRIADAADTATVWEWARNRHVHTVATSARGGTSFWQAQYTRPILLVMGSEHEGLDRATIETADQLVTIPMQGAMSSLNVGIAASLLLYELQRIAEEESGGPAR